ncbi:MAG TPA: 5-deoxy-glucuronate isomerase [Rectinemataceae bacterium]|nr:5-deoxy-glucuronate isomerase [Rectinemataceae bacterium]
MILKHKGPFARGYEAIVERGGENADMLMDFAVLSLGPGESWASGAADEKAILLVSGELELEWSGEPGGRARAARGSFLDEAPTVLHLSAGSEARLVAGGRGAELAVMRTDNPRGFPPRLWLPKDCRDEERGKGTMRETSTRIVRTVFDDSNAPAANLVVGEVVAAPGKWSSYPPHHHPQPEIYHYRFQPAQGFGLTVIGEEAHLLGQNDTVLIREGQVHPQVAAPGYAMWYIWVIRHLDGNRYVKPKFVAEHEWVQDPDAAIWLAPSERSGPGPGAKGR